MPQNNTSPTSEEMEKKLKDKLSGLALEKEEENARNMAYSLGLDYINLYNFPIAPEALRLISEEEARQFNTVCFWLGEKEAKLATTLIEKSKTREFQKIFEERAGVSTRLFFVSQNSLKYALDFYKTLPKIYQPSKGVQITSVDLARFEDKIKTFKDLNEEIKNVSISDIVTLIVASAINSRASDIHIEAEEKEIKVRFRVDGVLVDVADIDKDLWKSIISRIKLLSALKININNQPQDGRFTINLPNDKVDVRVSTLPTAFGESVVMRLLRSSSVGLQFEDLGLIDRAFDILSRAIKRPNGMIITTGPTGSGKTTTLYAILNKINRPEIKILTLEDPIEYHLEGINQSQVDKEKDYTFAKGLRSLMRQDPDVIMIGEIRDGETAEIAIQAALTGHLVISTLHTNDAAGAIPRFIALGAKPFLLAPALNVIIAQRLVRRICPECKKETKLSPDLLKRVSADLNKIPQKNNLSLEKLKFYKGEGCSHCQGLGYHGRIGIYEVLEITSEAEKIINEGDVSEYKIKEFAASQGMVPMVGDGLLKAINGITTVDEVYRVIE